MAKKKFKLAKKYQNRLLKLAKFLREQVPPSLLYMRQFMMPDKNGHVHERASIECGTPACAMGWATAVFPELVYNDNDSSVIVKGSRDYNSAYAFFGFGLAVANDYSEDDEESQNIAEQLFGGDVQRTPKQEAALIERTVKRLS